MTCATFALLAGCSSANTAETAVSIAASPAADPQVLRDRAVAQIYRDARMHDINALEVLRAASTPALPEPPDPAVAFALFLVDRGRFKDDFIHAYAVSPDGVNGDYGTRLSRARLSREGEHVPIDAIASFAAASSVARERLLSALAHSDDARLSSYADASGRVLVGIQPWVALATLVALPVAERLAATSEVDWCRHRPDRILAFVPTSTPTVTPTASTTALATSASSPPSPAGTPTASPTPAPLVLVQRQIRQSLDTCRLLAQGRSRQRAHARRPRRTRKKPSITTGA